MLELDFVSELEDTTTLELDTTAMLELDFVSELEDTTTLELDTTALDEDPDLRLTVIIAS